MEPSRHVRLWLTASASLALGASCREPSDSAALDDTDRDPLVVLDCTDGSSTQPEDLPALYTNQRGQPFRVASIDSEHFDELYAVVSVPSEPITLYDEGAPVVISTPPCQYVNLKWEENPQFYIPEEYGVIEVLPVLPGWSVQGHQTAGSHDYGGLDSARAIAEVIAWVTSGEPCASGHTLSQISSMSVCHAPAVLLASSSGGAPAMIALDEHADALRGRLIGLAAYENPSNAQFTTADAGAIWLDPDDQGDGDGDGFVWDDGRNLSFDDDSCGDGVCSVDYSAVAWSTEVSFGDIWVANGGSSTTGPPGMLYLDRNGNGRLDLTDDDQVDLDGNGVVDIDEDTYFKPQIRALETLEYAYAPQAIEAAIAHGVLDESAWPELLSTLSETEAFWAERSMFERVPDVAAAWGDGLTVAVAYSAIPHGPAFPSRPNTRQLHDAFLAQGTKVRYNADPELIACTLGGLDLGDYQGGPDAGTILTGEEMPTYAVPEDGADEYARVPGTLTLFWDAVGPFPRCQ
jgi:hypothetical protein